MRKYLSMLSGVIVSIALMSGGLFPAEKPLETGAGFVKGLLVADGSGSLAGGTVFFFNELSGPAPSSTRYWRVPDYAFKISDDGSFQATLPAGSYYMGASKKLSGGPLGPPQDGDLFFISEDEKGNPLLHKVQENQTLNMGTVTGAAPFSRTILVTEGITSLEGTIRNEQGRPLDGMIVFAFSNPMMVGRPLYVSERSSSEGTYLLRLAGGGSYYLRTRDDYGGGPPSADQVMGIYGKGQPVTVVTGQNLKGIDFTVTKVGIAE
ncbi:MAG: hypothetical protein JSU90_11100 [Nitrospiraceae bacterium]|nr:MAG: hypothetical protein JSU90_11100 [Nitrospiraceae bacterium]